MSWICELLVRGFLSNTGAKKHSDIETTLNQINTIIESTNSSLKSDTEIDVHLAEIISLLKTIPENIEYKIEALDLVVSELLKKRAFDQADTTYTQFSNKIKESFTQIEDSAAKISLNFFGNEDKLDPNQKLFLKHLHHFERDWKNRRKKALDQLKNIKKGIDSGFDQWIAKSKQAVEKNITKLKRLKSDTFKKFSKFPELLESKTFYEAKKIIKGTETRTKSELDSQSKELDQLSPDLQPVLKNLITEWKSLLQTVQDEIPKLLTFHTTQLYTGIVNEHISKLQNFATEIEQKTSNLASLIEKRMLIMAEEVYKEIEEQKTTEFEQQRHDLEEHKPILSKLEYGLIWKWQKELTNNELTIQTNLSSLKKQLETAVIADNLYDLEQFNEESQERLSAIKELISQEKFANIERELESLQKDSKTLFKQHHNLITITSQDKTLSSEVHKFIDKWKEQLEITEKDFQDSVSDVQNKFTEQHVPHLLNKIEKFIKQNTELLEKLLNEYHNKAMNFFESHFSNPSDRIHQLLDEQKKILTQELKNKDEHVQLVFSRYEKYPIEAKQLKWDDQLKALKNRFNDAQKQILDLVGERDIINHVLDKYYDIAQPAYGYKVPLENLSRDLEVPQDRLESILVDLISHKIISGEIDPITKAVVLAPRVKPEELAKKKPLHLRCMVCNLIINPSKEEIVYCPHCNSPAHRPHLIEWIKIKSACPNCKRTIKML